MEKQIQINKTKLTGTIIGSGLFALIGLVQGGLIFQLLFSIPIAIYFFICIFISLYHKQYIALFMKLIIWIIAISLGLGYQWYLSCSYRNKADEAAALVVSYKNKYGYYPETTEFRKILKNQFPAYKIHYIYLKENQQPHLYYYSPNTVFDSYIYDFEVKQWVFQPS